MLKALLVLIWLGVHTQSAEIVAKSCLTIETIRPNLILTKAAHIRGRVTVRLHQQGPSADRFDPVANSRIELRRYISQTNQANVSSHQTNEGGQFDLGTVGPGRYRLLASPSRFMSQPRDLRCSSEECYLDIRLELTPTDMPTAACPIR